MDSAAMQSALASLRSDVDRQQGYLETNVGEQLKNAQELANNIISRLDTMENEFKTNMLKAEQRRETI